MSDDRYRLVSVATGERYDVIGPDGKQVGFIMKPSAYGWCYRLWQHDWICAGDSLDAAFENVVADHRALVQ